MITGVAVTFYEHNYDDTDDDDERHGTDYYVVTYSNEAELADIMENMWQCSEDGHIKLELIDAEQMLNDQYSGMACCTTEGENAWWAH